MRSLLRSCHTVRPTISLRVSSREKHNSFNPLTDVDRVSIRKFLKCPLNCLCSKNIEVDYKNIELLSQFISPVSGKMLSRFSTGICAGKQKAIVKSIKRARASGLMSFTFKIPAYISPDLLPKPYNLQPPPTVVKIE